MRNFLSKGWHLAPRSLAARGSVAILLASLCVGLAAAWTFRLQAAADIGQREVALAVALAVPLEAQLGRSDPNRADAPLRAAADWQRRLCWAAVLSPDGHDVEFRRRVLVRHATLRTAALRASRAGARWVAWDEPETPAGRFQLLTVPQPEGRCLAALFDLDGLPTGPSVLGQAGAIALGLLGVVMALVYLRVAVVRPVTTAARRALQVRDDVTEALLQADAPTELAGLVAAANSTQRELQQWRAQATYLHHARESTVAERTRSVERALRDAERDADRDTLTGLLNRRALERDLPPLIAAHQRSLRELSVVLIDVNHFKTVNDQLGHAAGDELLAFVGDLLQACTRRGSDLTVRSGGDEFVLVLPDATARDATESARRLDALFQQRVRATARTEPAAGLACGVASLIEHHASDMDDLLHRADAAMYHAKRNGQSVATCAELRARRATPPGANP